MQRTYNAAEREPVEMITVIAFDRDKQGRLKPAFDPKQVSSRGRAITMSRNLELIHTGVVAFSQFCDPEIGEYGEADELYRAGDVPDLE